LQAFQVDWLNWDQGQFFHPSERFLNMTIQELQLPKNLLEYFDPQQSTLISSSHWAKLLCLWEISDHF
jgi:hypothetical protein